MKTLLTISILFFNLLNARAIENLQSGSAVFGSCLYLGSGTQVQAEYDVNKTVFISPNKIDKCPYFIIYKPDSSRSLVYNLSVTSDDQCKYLNANAGNVVCTMK